VPIGDYRYRDAVRRTYATHEMKQRQQATRSEGRGECD